ncbi:gamma-aminobutyric acid receptor subunit rho-3 [Caerostris extrusa]|uniref:Gamma-aminobutyric acid receptor subunit rho-3 n=1 Tax=Caerostris extrusa TaxID=172846 RepID=A0AAV4R7E3_CAEEX|nr:gamma-aminobutyric acid receptor subunit rho-3 [Caerostris extrusa]
MDIDEITEEKMEFSMQFYVNEYWKDPRLNLTNKNKYFHIPKDILKEMWSPDLIFENSKGGWVYQLAVPNIIVQTHMYNYIHRFTRMILKWFHERKKNEYVENIQDLYLGNIHPLKYQIANSTTSKQTFQWPIANFRNFHTTFESSTAMTDNINSGYSCDNNCPPCRMRRPFTSLRANFTFVRHLSSHIFNVYIPSGLVVMLSFLSFFLNVRSVPARVALGLTSASHPVHPGVTSEEPAAPHQLPNRTGHVVVHLHPASFPFPHRVCHRLQLLQRQGFFFQSGFAARKLQSKLPSSATLDRLDTHALNDRFMYV